MTKDKSWCRNMWYWLWSITAWHEMWWSRGK